jgi:hypothetical protein
MAWAMCTVLHAAYHPSAKKKAFPYTEKIHVLAFLSFLFSSSPQENFCNETASVLRQTWQSSSFIVQRHLTLLR